MKLLIVGATGGTGRELVRQALERGHQVTALARNPTKLRQTHEQLRIHKGNVLDAASVEEAVQGQDAVLCALGHKRWYYPNAILSQGTRNLLAAMQQQSVRRFICETSLGLGDSVGRMGLRYTLFVIPFILPFYYWDKRRQEAVVEASDLKWTLVRPGLLTNRRARGRYRHGQGLGSYLWTVRISRADVATFMLDQLEATTYIHATPGVCW